MKLRKQLQEAWKANQRANLRLLAAMDGACLGVRYAPRSRSVRTTWLHIHNMRLGWMDAVMKHPPVVVRLKSRTAHEVALLQLALEESSEGILEMIAKISKKKKIKDFEGSPASFVGMMLAHEAHHRGQMILALRLAGKALPKDVVFGLWEALD